MILQENARKPGVHPRSCIPLAIESANSLRFLWTALSIEGAAFSIESARKQRKDKQILPDPPGIGNAKSFQTY